MPEDENVVAQEQEVIEQEPEVTPEPEVETPDPEAGYQGKLNATNRFLKKEGYTFNEETKQWQKPAVTPQDRSEPQKEQSPASLTRDEAIVLAKGFSEDELEYAKKVAAVEGIKVTEALENSLFKTWKSTNDEAVKRQKAQLGTSRGARSSVKKTIDAPGLSDDEHKAMFAELNG